jgi:hypothetical protein
MAFKKLAAVAVMVAVATPSLAFDVKDAGTSTMFYISIPLDYSLSKKEQQWAAGLQLQGKREYQAVNLDSRMLNFLPLGGLEAKWIIAGVVAAGAAVAVGSKDKGTTSSLQAQQTQQQQNIQAAKAANPDCPTPISDPCKK